MGSLALSTIRRAPAHLSAILMAREKITKFGGRNVGLHAFPPLRIYVSPEAHSSIKKAAWLAGIGSENVVEVPTNEKDQLDANQLDRKSRKIGNRVFCL